MEMMGEQRCILAHPKACSITIRNNNENVDFRTLKYFNYRIIFHSALHHVLLLSRTKIACQRCVTYLIFQQRTKETPCDIVSINSAYKRVTIAIIRNRYSHKQRAITLPGHALGYLADDCQLVTDARARQLRSADTSTIINCPPHIQLFRRQDLCSCFHQSLEQFAVRLMKNRLVILPVQAVAEYIFIWTARPRRIVNSINCAV